MKTIPVLLQKEIDRSSARLAKCMRIERRDGNVYGFTTNSKPLVISGLMYLPAASFNPSDIASGSNLDTDDVQIEGLLSSATITEDDIRAGRWDYAQFRIFRVNWASVADGVIKDRAGNLGKVTVTRQTFIAEMLGMMEAYGTSIGKITQSGCRTSLGTPECGITPTSVNGTVLLCETDFFTVTDAARTEPDGFFDEGIFTINSGPGMGLQYEVKAYLVGLWVTKTAIAYDVTGETYTMTEGCSRRFQEDCVERFNNAVNFRGEPWLRGTDALIQIGRHSS